MVSTIVKILCCAYFMWSNTTEKCGRADCFNSDEVVVVSAQDLASKIGQDDGPIWLSFFGQIYDVTSGRDFYGPDGGYNFFAGKDASPTFHSGEFNDEGLKVDIRTFSPQELQSLETWQKFYDDHETYKFVGLLEGIYYDAEGKPTPLLNEITEKIASVNKVEEL